MKFVITSRSSPYLSSDEIQDEVEYNQMRYDLAFRTRQDPKIFLNMSIEEFEITLRAWNNYAERQTKEG